MALTSRVDLITAKLTSNSTHLDAEASLNIQRMQREIRRKNAVELVTIRSPDGPAAASDLTAREPLRVVGCRGMA